MAVLQTLLGVRAIQEEVHEKVGSVWPDLRHCHPAGDTAVADRPMNQACP